jgi:hypothetical protein
MRIGIDINNVLRDTLKRIEQIYEKWYIENPYMSEDSDNFEYKIISTVNSLDLKSHLSFKNDEHLYDFLYSEHTMEIFGHSGSVEFSSFHDLNDFYLEFRDDHEIILVSDEIGKSKPATLFFLSKFGCLVENISFYSEQTKNLFWDKVDVLLTANPDLLLNKPETKILIKFLRNYNEGIIADYEIENIKELKNKITEIYAKSIG